MSKLHSFFNITKEEIEESREKAREMVQKLGSIPRGMLNDRY